MSREIKFRAWEKKNKIMRQVNMLETDSDLGLTFQCQYYSDGEYTWRREIELMQYIGLKDKNGKEIYEGDIVKWSDGDYKHPHNPRIAIVESNPDIQFKTLWGKVFNFGNFAYQDTENHLEVIGNIYENPELLETKQAA